MQHETVQEYYGETLQGSVDLQTNACCTPEDMPDFLKKILAKIHDDVLSRYYGCGLVAPEVLTGLKVLDLGSGSGRDVYALSALVGEDGFVTGVDMTDVQLDVARAHIDFHADAFGFSKPNTAFVKGTIEDLGALGFEDNSFDLIISNCVINLALDKEAVLSEALRILKPGGEMYFSDVYCDRRVPVDLRDDPVLYGECLSGALYRNDFMSLAKSVGFGDPRMVDTRVLTVENPQIEAKLGGIGFTSETWRLFKLENIDADQEDYGQAVIYNGQVEHMPQMFVLDGSHVFEAGKCTPVSGNTWQILQQSRFAQFFEFIGGFTRHFGAFVQNSDVCAPKNQGVTAEPEDSCCAPSVPSGGCCG